MSKADLRKTYLEKRSRIGLTEMVRSSGQIAERFFSDVTLPPGPTLLTFIRSSRTNEIDTSAIYYRLWSKRPDVRTCAPRMTEHEPGFECVAFDGNTRFIENRLNIREPSDGQVVEPDEIDIVIVPLLAYDVSGDRIGYGGGYFDRFLVKCRPDIVKVGVSLFDPEPAFPDVEPTDIALDICITPTKTYRFYTDRTT